MGFSVVLSDMCPSVSGITTQDAALSVELGMQALNLAVGQAAMSSEPDDTSEMDGPLSSDDKGALRARGNLVIKLLESEDIQGESRE